MSFVLFKRITKQQGSQTIRKYGNAQTEFKRITKQQGSQTNNSVYSTTLVFKRITKQQGSQTRQDLQRRNWSLRELQNNKALKRVGGA